MDLPLQTHDRPGHRVRAGLGAALLVETPLGPRAARFLVSACAAHGLDVREDVEKMLTIDYLMANFDRHWNNFGVLIDSESREWLRAAPVFDTGEALWCDRELSQPRTATRPRGPA